MAETNGNNSSAGTDYAKRMRLERAKETARETPSVGAMIAKTIVGAIIIVAGAFVGGNGFNVGTFIGGLIIGLVLIAWGILGYKQQQKRIEDARLDVVLSTLPDSFSNPEIDALTQKYDEAESAGNKKE